MLCVECGAAMRRTDEPITDVYKNEEITVEGIPHYKCDACGETVMDADALGKWAAAADEEYRKQHGLLTPADIAKLRKSLGMTQAEFQKVLGVKSPTVSRWETGAVIQTETANKLMVLMRNVPCVADELKAMEEIGRPAAGCIVRSGSWTVPSNQYGIEGSVRYVRQ